MTTSPVSVASKDAPTGSTTALAEICTGLLIIIASSYAIAASYAGAPLIAAAYGLALGVIARQMWKDGTPRSLRWLCVSFGVTSVALAILGAIS